MTRRVLAFLVALTMVFALLPISATAAQIVDSGSYCGPLAYVLSAPLILVRKRYIHPGQ